MLKNVLIFLGIFVFATLFMLVMAHTSWPVALASGFIAATFLTLLGLFIDRAAPKLHEPLLDAVSDAMSNVDTFQTKKGSVIVSWGFASLKGLRAEEGAIRAKLNELLQANPDTDLSKFAPAIGIAIAEVERSWTKTESAPGIWDQLRAHAKQGKPLQEFLDKNPHLSEPKLRRKAQNIYHQTLADEADDDEG